MDTKITVKTTNRGLGLQLTGPVVQFWIDGKYVAGHDMPLQDVMTHYVPLGHDFTELELTGKQTIETPGGRIDMKII